MRIISIALLLFFVFKIASAQPSKNLSLLDSVVFSQQTLAGCWHYNDLNGNEYALAGAANGIDILDITNPSQVVDLFQLPGVANLWHEVKVKGDFGYAVTEGTDSNGIMNGLQIIDLRYLPDSAPTRFYKGDGAILNQLVTAHSVTVDGHYLYLNGHNISTLGGGVLILDITNPLFPVYIGAITTRYSHDSFAKGDTIITSDIHEGMFSIYNISDRTNPVLLATQVTPGQFNHNSGLSDDGHIVFTVDERINTPLASFDITDFNNITLLDTFYNGYFPNSEVHNIRLKNDFLINPSYGSQLTIADASRPMNIIEVANYTTGNSLCWDADPYLNSGNIIATDMNSGTFFVFSPIYIRACYLEGNVTDSMTGQPLNNVSVDILVAGKHKLSDASGDYRTGYADSGSYTVVFSKTDYKSKQFTVSLHNGVLTNLNVQLVRSNIGIEEIDESSVMIYPNPAKEIINISSDKFFIEEWKIIDQQGKVVFESNANFSSSGNFMIDIRSLSKGLYTVSLQNKSEKLIKTFIRE